MHIESFEANLRGVVLGSFLRAASAFSYTKSVEHRLDPPDRRRLRSWSTVAAVDPLDGLALLLHELVEQREMAARGGPRRRRRRRRGPTMQLMAVLVTRRRWRVGTDRRSFDGWEAVLVANNAIGFTNIGVE